MQIDAALSLSLFLSFKRRDFIESVMLDFIAEDRGGELVRNLYQERARARERALFSECDS